MSAWQPSLLGHSAPSLDAQMTRMRRIQLGPNAWIDSHPGWIRGHDTLFDRLRRETQWTSSRRMMYQREVDVPRLFAEFPDTGPTEPMLQQIRSALDARYSCRFGKVSMALYRDGRDSVAWHSDKDLSETDAMVALISVGEPRRFLVRPVGGRVCQTFRVGWGDLVVMGGAAQRGFEHCIPKVSRAGPRIVIMYRWSA